MDLNGSFLTPSCGTIVSTVSSSQPLPTGNPIAEGDTMMAYHKRIDSTNQALLKRVADLENQCVNPAIDQANVTADPLTPTLPMWTNNTQLTGQHHSSLASSSSSQVDTPQSVYTSLGLPGPSAQFTQSSHLHNAVIPDPSMQFPLFRNQCLTFVNSGGQFQGRGCTR